MRKYEHKNAVKLESMEKSLRLSKIFFFFKFLKLLSRDMKNYTLHYMQFKNSSLFWQLGKYRMKISQPWRTKKNNFLGGLGRMFCEVLWVRKNNCTFLDSTLTGTALSQVVRCSGQRWVSLRFNQYQRYKYYSKLHLLLITLYSVYYKKYVRLIYKLKNYGPTIWNLNKTIKSY